MPTIVVTKPMTSPDWALKERKVLDLNTRSAELWAKAYLLPNDYRCMPYGIGPGQAPDDYFEAFFKLPLLYLLGAGDSTRGVWWRAVKGNIAQCTEKKFYTNEFIKCQDGYHIGEQYGCFCLGALMMPDDPEYRRLALKFASFYDATNSAVANYDPIHKTMRSAMHGGNGPLLDKSNWDSHATKYWPPELDYAFDSPAGMTTTCFLTNACALTGDLRYKETVLGYIDAWRRRAEGNGGVIPSKVNLDGTRPVDWWGGTLGWTSDYFSGGLVITSGPTAGWSNALLLTGDTSYWDNWRTTADAIWQNRYIGEDGKAGCLPGRIDDAGWYGSLWYASDFGTYGEMLANIYMATMKKEDLNRCFERSMMSGPTGFGAYYEVGRELDWIRYLSGRNPGWPIEQLDDMITRSEADQRALRHEMLIGQSAERKNGVRTVGWCGPLVQMMMGGVTPKWTGQPLLVRFCYFDPERRRPGITTE